MQEKDMVNDVLSSVKGSLTEYTSAITECSNTQLRQTLQQIRGGDETFQYDLYKLAEKKGFYTPAQPANTNAIQNVKSTFGK